MIDKFTGVNRWLSNFWPCNVILDGDSYTSTEAAYVAGKTIDMQIRKTIRQMNNTGEIKRFGRSLKIREDWNTVKVPLMLSLLRQKFKKGSELGDKLLETYPQMIIEGNTWGDTFWGVCRGKGENILGKLLMQVRSEITDKV